MENPLAEHFCPNCDAETAPESTYCHNCGQKQNLPPVTFRILLSQAWATITNFERGFWHTIIEMITKPGYMIRRYWNGATRDYSPPLRFAFVAITLSLAITFLFGMGDYMVEMQHELQSQSGQSEGAQVFANKVNAVVFKYLNFFSLLYIPFISLIGKLFYRKQNVNYAKLFIAICYLAGIASIIGTPFSLIIIFAELPPRLLMVISLLLTIALYTYTLKRLFNQSWFLTFIKAIGLFIGGYILFILFAMLVGILFAIGMIIYAKKTGAEMPF